MTPKLKQSLRRSVVVLSLFAAGSAFAQSTILNVSYDVSRELYKEINPAFSAAWKKQGGADITVNQSHGGSSKQAGAVIGGLEADVITMNQSPDIDILVERGGLVAADWRKQFPHDATPYTTTSVFLVRKGNPKNIKDWNDLTRAGLQVIVPNPKTSGNGRYTYLAAWGYALEKTGSEAGAKDFVSKLFANVPVLDGGGRGATTTFTQRDVGDVLVTFENEAILIAQELGSSKFDIVYPSLSIDAAAPVAVVQKVAAKRGSQKVAKAYLDFLYTPVAQEIIARHDFRPRDPAVLKKHAAKYPAIRTFTVEQKLGGWAAVQKAHFADGALYDQILAKK
ncbi:sulfate transport system substrate-binding protein [Azonexus fungiphilus]|uniref:Sulfate transport system substrate-binding protein n=1 Tax=Azonexus fungiphilus TaxID=146940 RepID=A0A495WIT6_9RHOO|nr:sulfate ABC transporter substrate-binding protein [Azonexus fungiphilus]RKT60553.1 sulfate transport system substrate-binding protein [Azonexus fungiphilus]